MKRALAASILKGWCYRCSLF